MACVAGSSSMIYVDNNDKFYHGKRLLKSIPGENIILAQFLFDDNIAILTDMGNVYTANLK